MYNCKTKDVDSLTPFTYKFTNDVKLPDITPTAPAAVSATASSVTPSTAAAALSAGLASMTATGQPSAAVTQATADVAKAVTPEQTTAVTAAFTPTVLSNLTTSGTLPADLKAQVDAIAANPALQAYLPKFTFPSVNGKTVGGRVGVTPVDVVNTVSATQDDACEAGATAAFNTAIQGLNTAKTAQTATVTAQYTAAQATITADATSCKSGIPATYSGYKAVALQQLNSGLADLAAIRSIIGEAGYQQILLLYYVAYANAIINLNALQLADSQACDAVAAQRLANAQAARDKDISTINTNYNTAVATATTTRNQTAAACHNQGGGRKSADQ
ncbi:hypothetical protein GCM10028810_08160 [Spirosoma litoris]